MSEHKLYDLLESNEISTIIKEKWHGSNAQNFGLFTASTFYSILVSNHETEEARRLFRVTPFI